MLIVTVGISGSGKSYWSRQKLRNNLNWKIVCPDIIRKQTTGNISNQENNREVWKIAYAELDFYLKDNETVIFDSTACNLKTIKELIKKAQEYNAEIQFKVFYCDPVLAFKVIESDIEAGIDRSDVPFEVVKKQYKNFKEVVKYLKENKYTIRMF